MVFKAYEGTPAYEQGRKDMLEDIGQCERCESWLKGYCPTWKIIRPAEGYCEQFKPKKEKKA